MLSVFGQDYVRHATGLLRLLALSTIPAIVPTTYISAARVHRRLGAMTLVTAASSLPVLVLTPVLIPSLGIAGVGVAWLAVQSVVAGALLVVGIDARRAPAADDVGLGTEVAPSAHPVRVVEPDAVVDDSLPAPVAAPIDLMAHLRARTATTDVVPGPDEIEPDHPFAVAGAPGDEPPAPARRRLLRPSLPRWWPAITAGGALGLWVVSLAQLGSGTVGRFGLVSGLPITYFLALALVVTGTIVAIRRGAHPATVVAHLGLFVLIVHATPAIAYSELRYAWAWRHVGIVDLMQRRHLLVPDTPVLPIYQHWPGFFTAATTFTEASGFRSALSFAAWSPPVFGALDALALAALFATLTTDRRRVALGVWLFLVANWIGQDYFAPQAFSFFLYLVALTIVLRWFRRRRPGASPVRTPPATRRTLSLLLLAVMAATVVSHPLTPIVLCLSLVGLTVTRALDRRWPAAVMVILTAGWMVTGARDYTFSNLTGLLSGFGRPGSNVGSNLANLNQLSAAQHVVADAGRMVVLVMAVLAGVAFVMQLRRRRVEWVPVVLVVAPLGILAGGSYGGEAVFRAYLFALPFAAFLAAGCFWSAASSRISGPRILAMLAVSLVLLTGFLLAYFGKEAWARFTPAEVRAAARVFDRAPDNSLLIDGTGSSPTQFRHAERFTYVTLAAEPAPSLRKVLDHPARVLASWMSDPRFARGYLIITRSQIAEADGTGSLPPGALRRIRRALVASPRFRVLVENPDALVLTVPTSGTPGERAP